MISIEFESSALDAFLDKISNPYDFFASPIGSSMSKMRDDLIATTNVFTGDTKAAWGTIKQSKGEFSVQNSSNSETGYQVVRVLNDGRGEVRPVKKRRLYIPLSIKGRRKRLGEKIPDDFEYGVDYVLAKKAKPFKGTRFIDNSLDSFADYVSRKMAEKFLAR